MNANNKSFQLMTEANNFNKIRPVHVNENSINNINYSIRFDNKNTKNYMKIDRKNEVRHNSSEKSTTYSINSNTKFNVDLCSLKQRMSNLLNGYLEIIYNKAFNKMSVNLSSIKSKDSNEMLDSVKSYQSAHLKENYINNKYD